MLWSERWHPCCWRLQSIAHLVPQRTSHSLMRFIRIFFSIQFLENALHHVIPSLCFVQHLRYTERWRTVNQPEVPRGAFLSPHWDKHALVLCRWPESHDSNEPWCAQLGRRTLAAVRPMNATNQHLPCSPPSWHKTILWKVRRLKQKNHVGEN